MPVPEQFVTQADLEDALTAEKVRQLLGDKGKPEPSASRVRLVLESGHGFVLGHIQRQVKNKSLDALWDSGAWSDRDKAETRRLVLGACIYYAHHYGQKAEEVPESVMAERDYIEQRAQAVGDNLATLGADPPPANSPQHVLGYTTSVGHYPAGSVRSNWRGF
jgi:hypothetical protein